MKKKKKALCATAILIQWGLLSMDRDLKEITPRTQEKRQELIEKWGDNFISVIKQQDNNITDMQNAINILANFDLDAPTPRTPDIRELPDGLVTIEYNRLPELEKILVIATPTISIDDCPVSRKTPLIKLTDDGSPQSPGSSQKRKKSIIEAETRKNQPIKIFFRVCVAVGILAGLIYFLKNMVHDGKLYFQ